MQYLNISISKTVGRSKVDLSQKICNQPNIALIKIYEDDPFISSSCHLEAEVLASRSCVPLPVDLCKIDVFNNEEIVYGGLVCLDVVDTLCEPQGKSK